MDTTLKEPTPGRDTTPTSIRVTPAGHYLWKRIALEMGLNRTGVLETLLREKAERMGIQPPNRFDDTAAVR